MKRPLSFLAMLLVTSQVILAQPTLTATGINPVPGEMFLTQNADTVGFNPGSGGANQTWDFSSFPTNANFTINAFTPGSTPNGASFPNANLALEGGGVYDYYETSSTAFTRVGADNGSTTIPYSDGETLLTFPMTYNTSFVDSFAAAYFSGVAFNRSGTVSVEADGYGTLITPQATFQNVLRVHFVEDYEDDGGTFTFQYNTDIYGWYLQGTHTAVYSWTKLYINGSLGAQYARFADQSVVSSSGLTEFNSDWIIFPNPATDRATIQLDALKNGHVSVEVRDLRGALVQSLPPQLVHAGMQHLPLDLQGLSAGLYLVQIEMNGQTQSQKLRLF